MVEGGMKMSIEDKIQKLREAVEEIGQAYFYAEEAEYACKRIGVYPSHHALMELGDCLTEAQEKLAEAEQKLRDLEDSL